MFLPSGFSKGPAFPPRRGLTLKNLNSKTSVHCQTHQGLCLARQRRFLPSTSRGLFSDPQSRLGPEPVLTASQRSPTPTDQAVLPVCIPSALPAYSGRCPQPQWTAWTEKGRRAGAALFPESGGKQEKRRPTARPADALTGRAHSLWEKATDGAATCIWRGSSRCKGYK